MQNSNFKKGCFCEGYKMKTFFNFLFVQLSVLLPISNFAQVSTVLTIGGKPVNDGNVIKDAIVFHIVSNGPKGLPQIKIDGSTARIDKGQIIMQLVDAEVYGTLPDSATDFEKAGPLIEGIIELKENITHGISFGKFPELESQSKTTLIPLFPSDQNSKFVKITGKIEGIMTQSGLKPLFFAKGAAHTLIVKRGEYIKLCGVSYIAANDTELLLTVDTSDRLKAETFTGKLEPITFDKNASPIVLLGEIIEIPLKEGFRLSDIILEKNDQIIGLFQADGMTTENQINPKTHLPITTAKEYLNGQISTRYLGEDSFSGPHRFVDRVKQIYFGDEILQVIKVEASQDKPFHLMRQTPSENLKWVLEKIKNYLKNDLTIIPTPDHPDRICAYGTLSLGHVSSSSGNGLLYLWIVQE